MRNKLSKLATQWLGDCIDRFAEKKDAIDVAVSEWREAIEQNADNVVDLRSNLHDAIEDYNSEIEDANNLIEHVKDAQQHYFDNRSESWQEGDTGQAYESWMESWDIELESISDEEFTEDDEPDLEHGDELSELPEEIDL